MLVDTQVCHRWREGLGTVHEENGPTAGVQERGQEKPRGRLAEKERLLEQMAPGN